MVFIEACLGPVHLVRSSRTRSSGQNWTPSTIQTIQTPSRPGSRQTRRKQAGEDPPWHRPLCAQTLFYSTTLRADVHVLPELSEPQEHADRAYNYTTPSSEAGVPPRDPPSLTGWFWRAKSLFVSLTGHFWRANRSSSLPLAKTSGKLLDWPGVVVTSCGALSSCRGISLAGRRSPHSLHPFCRGPRGSSLNSAHHDVGNSEAKEAK